jgi:hypothetical protein
MVYDFQVVFDCGDPVALAEFWAQALGYVSEPPPVGFDSWEKALTAWQVPPEDWETMRAVVPPEFDHASGLGPRPRVLFMKVPEEKSGKNRLHLDVRVGGPRGTDPAERWERIQRRAGELEALGAVRVREAQELGLLWIVMQDPEGNEFCVA